MTEILEKKIQELLECIENIKGIENKNSKQYTNILKNTNMRLDELDKISTDCNIVDINEKIKNISLIIGTNEDIEQCIPSIKEEINAIKQILENKKNENNVIMSTIDKFKKIIKENIEKITKEQTKNTELLANAIEEIEKNQNLNYTKIEDFQEKSIRAINEALESIKKVQTDSYKEFETNIESFNDSMSKTQQQNVELFQKTLNEIQSFQNEKFEILTEGQNKQNEISTTVNEIKKDIEILNERSNKNTEILTTNKDAVLNLVKTIESKFKEFESNGMISKTEDGYLIDNKATVELLEKITELNSKVTVLDKIIAKSTEIESENTLNEIQEFVKASDLKEKLEYFYKTLPVINKDTANIVADIDTIKYDTNEIKFNTDVIKTFVETSHTEMKCDLRTLQEQFVMQMAQVFENISFASESEEIIDFVDESTFAIKEEINTLKQAILNYNVQSQGFENTSEVKILRNEIFDIARKIDKTQDNVDTEFQDLKSDVNIIKEGIAQKQDTGESYFNEHFNKLCDLITNQSNSEYTLLKEAVSEIKKITANADTENEYSYSMPDIESDLAKMRMVLNEINEALENKNFSNGENNLEERFNTIYEDISSISKRTNKLILTSDNATKMLMEHLEIFNNRVQEFNQKNRMEIVEQKVDAITKIALTNTKSAKMLNDAFMHLAGWIDETTETMTNNTALINSLSNRLMEIIKETTEISEINEKVSTMPLLEKVLVKNTDNMAAIPSIDGKLTALASDISLITTMNSRIEFLYQEAERQKKENTQLKDLIEKQEKLIERLYVKVSDFSNMELNPDKDTKAVLKYVANQSASAAENTSDLKGLLQRFELLEHKIGTFEKNIAKIVSYIDEE